MREEGSLRVEFVRRTEHGACALVVGGQATYRQAADLRHSLISAITTTGDGLLMVDLSSVDRMDTASMAVLVEGFILTQDRTTEILLCGPSDSVRAVFRLAGLHEALGKCVSCREEALRRIQAART